MFDNRIIAVGSTADFLHFNKESIPGDLDFVFSADDYVFIKTRILEINPEIREYGGKFCGRKFAGRINGEWVDFFMSYPFTQTLKTTIEGIDCQLKSDRVAMVLHLLNNQSDSKWASKCREKFFDLVNRREFSR